MFRGCISLCLSIWRLLCVRLVVILVLFVREHSDFCIQRPHTMTLNKRVQKDTESFPTFTDYSHTDQSVATTWLIWCHVLTASEAKPITTAAKTCSQMSNLIWRTRLLFWYRRFVGASSIYLQYLLANAASRSLYGVSERWAGSLSSLWTVGDRRSRLWQNPTRLEENQYSAMA